MAKLSKPTAAQLKVFAKTGIAMPDGSYYIRNADDLESAIKLSGVGNASTVAVRQHIIKRAKSLGLLSKLPATWNTDGTTKAIAQMESAGKDFIEHHGVKGQKWGVRRASLHENRAAAFNKAADRKASSRFSGLKKGSIANLRETAKMHEDKAAELRAKANSSVEKVGESKAKQLVKAHGKEAISKLTPSAKTQKAGQTLAKQVLKSYGKQTVNALTSHAAKATAAAVVTAIVKK